MTGYTFIECHRAQLEVHIWLVGLWPQHLPLRDWPTYCGAGNGIGDWLIPDDFGPAHISPACFIHDLDYALLPREWWPFQQANNRLYSNIVELCKVQCVTNEELAKGKRNAMRYWIAVSVFGWRHFTPGDPNPWKNPTVRDRLNRLAKAQAGLK